MKEKKEENLNLTKTEKKQIEQDVRDIAGITDLEAPVVLDFESVKITKPGKYVLDIPNLFSKERPLVYKLEDGKYIIDIASQKF
jgi:predicted  nucleic acid-binding Zn-ribbon protein|tara:strand:- start:3015 stop:3266 length:252 start_codon:yes stop_codon:yes gene_type:complete